MAAADSDPAGHAGGGGGTFDRSGSSEVLATVVRVT
jgi:hypothetical protein